MVFFAAGVSAAVGLAVYLYNNSKRKVTQNDENDDGDNENENNSSNKKTAVASSSSTTSNTGTRPKDIWKVGNNSQSNIKKSKAAYVEKPFGSKYYYAHNDSNTTGGYKDGLKMEDYRMNGPRLLSVNGLTVDNNSSNDTDQQVDDDDNKNNKNGGGEEDAASTVKNNDTITTTTTTTRITAQDPDVKNVTKYLWDDPGNGKGIATIRIDVLPGDKFGQFVDWKDVEIKDVTATLPGEGLLAKITVEGNISSSYQLKINKLYGDAADVKVIIKPNRLLIKIYKKKHGFLSKRDNNLAEWPQPHRKI